jgi:hypothetical protein
MIDDTAPGYSLAFEVDSYGLLRRRMEERERLVEVVVGDVSSVFPRQQTALREFFALDRDLILNNAAFRRNVGQGVFEKAVRYVAQPIKVQAAMDYGGELPFPSILSTDIRRLLPQIASLRSLYDSDPSRLTTVVYRDMLAAGTKEAVEALKYIHMRSNRGDLDLDGLMFRHHGLRRSDRDDGWLAGFHVPTVSSISWPHTNPYEFKERGPYGLENWQVRKLVSRFQPVRDEIEMLQWELPGSYFVLTPVLRAAGEGYLLARSDGPGFVVTGIDFCDPEFVAALQYAVLARPEDAVIRIPEAGGSLYRAVASMDEGDRMTLLDQ